MPDVRPAAEVDITPDLVRELVASVRPDLADSELVEVGEGWDNSVWRLGPDLAVRVPRRRAAVPLLVNEQRWLPELAPRLTLPVPVPITVGSPTPRYPWPWSICQWVPGRSWADDPPEDQVPAARTLAGFLSALHEVAPDDAPTSSFRGGALASRDRAVRSRAAAIADSLDIGPLLALWDRSVAATGSDQALRSWVHGDLHPLNLACDGGTLSGVLDFGDITHGDPAVDLSAAWTIFDEPARSELFAHYEAGADLVVRAGGWALNHGLACLAGSADHHAVAEIGRRTLDRLIDEPPC